MWCTISNNTNNHIYQINISLTCNLKVFRNEINVGMVTGKKHSIIHKSENFFIAFKDLQKDAPPTSTYKSYSVWKTTLAERKEGKKEERKEEINVEGASVTY